VSLLALVLLAAALALRRWLAHRGALRAPGPEPALDQRPDGSSRSVKRTPP
jgi:hypothetical protein